MGMELRHNNKGGHFEFDEGLIHAVATEKCKF